MSERFGAGCLNPETSLENSMIAMNSFRPESHVAQQSRRDKLGVAHNLAPAHNIPDFTNQFLPLPKEPVTNPSVIQVGNLGNCESMYNPGTMFSSEMLNFSSSSHVLLTHKDAISHQESITDRSGRPMVLDDVSYGNPSSNAVSSSFNPSVKASDAQNSSSWKGLSSQHGSDWIMNYVSGCGNNTSNQNPLFVGGILSTSLKPGYSGYHDVHSSLNNPSSELPSQGTHKQYGELPLSSPSFYQNSLQEAVSSSTTAAGQGFEMPALVSQSIRETGHGPWVDGGHELVLLPSYGNQAPHLRLNNAVAWMNRPAEGSLWNSEDLVVAKTEGNLGTVAGDSAAQGLSLSLSSHPTSQLNVAEFEEGFGNEGFQSRISIMHGSQDSKANNSGYVTSYSKSSIGGAKVYGNSSQVIGGTTMDARRSAGPLGPFTGYATILKSSKFLRPARQLLDEFCSITNSKTIKTGEVSERSSGDASVSCDTLNAENEIGGRNGNSVVSTSSFYSSTDDAGEGGAGSGATQAYRPEYQRKKAKLLYMQEEVCRRYKQYHQQMQMVTSSFESVAGLSAATPYTSLALKAVSKHFRCLKNAISAHLRHVSSSLGEEFVSPDPSKGDTTPRLRFIDQGFRKPKAGESLGFLEHQQHVWRPQRGLPERSVAVLRTWLFEHFLHPYPTDTDKHMLAAQTGLTRNQVSNWFINARVRVWKPMVEEIHVLETKGSTEMDLRSGKSDGKPIAEDGESSENNRPNKLTIDAMSDKQLALSGAGLITNADDGCNSDQWQRGEKRSRMEECQVPASVDGGLMGFVPYQNGLEIGGLGAVSLTLGLRHNTESVHQQQHQQLTRHFGGQMVHDFVE